MYGRGVDDDRDISQLSQLFEKYIRESGDLPVNITFIIERGRGVASTDLDKYLAKHKRVGADLLDLGTRYEIVVSWKFRW